MNPHSKQLTNFIITAALGILLMSPGSIFGQNKYLLNIISDPIEAEIFINNNLIGHTPFNHILPFNFKKYPQDIIRISKKGYVAETFTISEEIIENLYLTKNSKEIFVENGNTTFQRKININLRLKNLSSIIDTFPNIVFGFDKMIFDVKEGSKIGELKYGGDLYWNPEQYETLEFNKIAEDFMDSLGFHVIKTNRLFSEEKIEKNPDLLLGASLKAISLNYRRHLDETKNEVNLKLSLQWQVFSIKKNKVIGNIKTIDSNIDYVGTLNNCFRATFLEGLTELLTSPDFKKTMSDFKTKPGTSLINKDIIIQKINTPSFQDYSKMVSSSVKSVVTVKTDIGHGSGFFISSDGLIITNNHVIEKAKEIEVIMNAGFSLPAQVVSYDADNDVAIIKIAGNGFKPLFLKDTDEVGIGEEVIAIGTPLDISLGQTVTKGIISGTRELEDRKLYQMDAGIQHGNSGGPLLNIKGEVIGICSYGFTKYGKEFEGLNFAIPIDVAIQKLHITFK